jgi:hypothetical protein
MKMEPFNPANLDYFPPGEPWSNGPDARAPQPPKFRRIINPADWEGLPVPPREWIVPGYIPHKTVTLLSGDGSVGKSLLALQLAVGRALAREWIGLMPEQGRTLILSAEDDADEMHRRLEDIRKFYGARMTDLGLGATTNAPSCCLRIQALLASTAHTPGHEIKLWRPRRQNRPRVEKRHLHPRSWRNRPRQNGRRGESG